MFFASVKFWSNPFKKNFIFQFEIITAVFDNGYAFGLVINGQEMFFTNQQVPGNYKYINSVGKLDECVIAANVFPGYEHLASGRGYVWGRTIPLFARYFLVGSGPDTFAIEFPQNDYEIIGDVI